MTLTLDSPEVTARFDAICKLRGAQGRGLSLPDLAAAHALAVELEAPSPDEGRIADHAYALGLDVNALGSMTSGER
jgi:hypothetical protein